MTEVKRPLDEKMEAKVPPVEAKDAPQGEETDTGATPADEEDSKK